MSNQIIKDLKAKPAKELAKEREWLKMVTSVSQSLGLKDDNWPLDFMFEYGADCHIEMEAETLQDAIKLAEGMEPVEVARVTVDGLSFHPWERLNEEELQNCQKIGPYVYDVKGIRLLAEQHFLRFWVKAGDFLVGVRVKVTNDQSIRRNFTITSDKAGNAIKHQCVLIGSSRHFNHRDKLWAPKDQPNDFVLWRS